MCQHLVSFTLFDYFQHFRLLICILTSTTAPADAEYTREYHDSGNSEGHVLPGLQLLEKASLILLLKSDALCTLALILLQNVLKSTIVCYNRIRHLVGYPEVSVVTEAGIRGKAWIKSHGSVTFHINAESIAPVSVIKQVTLDIP